MRLITIIAINAELFWKRNLKWNLNWLRRNQYQFFMNLKGLIMQIKQFEVWIADLNPQIGTEPGKTRPVLIIQTDLLNKIPHLSTIVCPITTKVEKEADILRVHLKKGVANVAENCDIMIDQIRAIDNKRLIKKIGDIPTELKDRVKENIRILLDLE
jgi:mRNA interferase MazF